MTFLVKSEFKNIGHPGRRDVIRGLRFLWWAFESTFTATGGMNLGFYILAQWELGKEVTTPSLSGLKSRILFPFLCVSPHEMQIVTNVIYILKLILLLALNSAAKPEKENSE